MYASPPLAVEASSLRLSFAIYTEAEHSGPMSLSFHIAGAGAE